MTSADDSLVRLVASPALLQAWHTSRRIESAYAWYLLNHSWLLPPLIPPEAIPHNPRLRLWDDAGGWTDAEPTTLTVFWGMDERARCRRATWRFRSSGELQRRLVEFVNGAGQVRFVEPAITVEDADVPFDRVQDLLRAIAACPVPAIPIDDPPESSVTTDVGSLGFEYFSGHQPPAGVKFEWSDRVPRDWVPVVERARCLRDLLTSCFH